VQREEEEACSVVENGREREVARTGPLGSGEWEGENSRTEGLKRIVTGGERWFEEERTS
jgi:hypothetical protein